MKFKVLISKGMDFGFNAIVPSLPGCMSHGDTVDEALANVREAIELYVEDMPPEEIETAATLSADIYEVAV